MAEAGSLPRTSLFGPSPSGFSMGEDLRVCRAVSWFAGTKNNRPGMGRAVRAVETEVGVNWLSAVSLFEDGSV